MARPSNLACAYSAEGKLNEAARAFRQARELDDTNVQVCSLARPPLLSSLSRLPSPSMLLVCLSLTPTARQHATWPITSRGWYNLRPTQKRAQGSWSKQSTCRDAGVRCFPLISMAGIQLYSAIRAAAYKPGQALLRCSRVR